MITFANKTTLNPQPSIANENKVTAGDMNEIKSVYNTEIGDVSSLTTSASSVVGAINEVNDKNAIIDLYNDSTGSNGTITLSDNASNYNFLEIYFYFNSGGGKVYKSVKIYNPNSKYVLLDFCDFASNLIFETKLVHISGTSITNTRYFHFTIANSSTWTPFGSNQNNIYISRVIGYK